MPRLRPVRARGVLTNGIGEVTTAHLNLTTSLARKHDYPSERRAAKAPKTGLRKPYAGYDKTEFSWWDRPAEGQQQ